MNTRCRRDDREFVRALCAALLGLTLALESSGAWAFDTGQSKTASGVAVYIGLMPAEIVKGHPENHAEATMHDGPPNGLHEYHLVVAIFDAKTGARIDDAKVFARVSSLGLPGSRRALEPMTIEGTVTYGNYFDLPYRGLYTIDLDIAQPNGLIKLGFTYEH